MDFEVRATNHTGFTVSSLDRTISLFANIFGFELISRAPRDQLVIQAITAVPGAKVEVAYLARSDHTVELLEYAGPADRMRIEARPVDTGAAHIAFTVVGIERLVEAAARYGAKPLAQVTVNPDGPNAGSRIVYLRDDDGLTIELIEKPKPEQVRTSP